MNQAQIAIVGNIDEVIADYPAYTIVREKLNRNGKLVLRYNGKYALSTKHTSHYMAGSVVSYALENGEDPIAYVERAKANGHELHWMTQLGACITSHKQPREIYSVINLGQTVEFEGRKFIIRSAPNGNIRLEAF